MIASDLNLLQQYARHHAEDAFAEIVRRHLGLVYSAALRQVRSPQLAEEIAQSVFTDLARSAARLKPDTIVTAWLYQVTRRTAIDVVRRETRRQLREQIATEMNAMNATTADWTHIEPLLDEAMSELDDTDRAAILLRYFENKSLRDVGATLGTSDDAAQKRVSRAVERLREFFDKRGIPVGTSGLAVVISANAVQAAPVGLAVTISTVSALAGTAITTTIATQTTTTTMNWINAKSIAALVASALVAGTVTHLTQQRETNRLHKENQSLIARQASLQSERDAALSAATTTNDELERLRKEKSELPRLRGEVAMLRKQANEFGKLREQNRQLGAGPVSAPSQSEQSLDGERDTCINNLRQIDGAMQQCALENRLTATNVLTVEQILPYIGRNIKELPHCPSGGTYAIGYLTNAPTCSIPGHALVPFAPPAARARTTAEQAAFRSLTESIEAYKRAPNGPAPKEFPVELGPAWKSYHAQNPGQTLTDLYDLEPYTTTPEESLAIHKLIDSLAK